MLEKLKKTSFLIKVLEKLDFPSFFLCPGKTGKSHFSNIYFNYHCLKFLFLLYVEYVSNYSLHWQLYHIKLSFKLRGKHPKRTNFCKLFKSRNFLCYVVRLFVQFLNWVQHLSDHVQFTIYEGFYAINLGKSGVEKASKKGPKWPNKWLIMDEICVFCIFQSQAITK